jgi:AAA+ ATPase superfamily predicted ATPase
MFNNRDEEPSFLNERYANISARELIVIYGRRRVGKTIFALSMPTEAVNRR